MKLQGRIRRGGAGAGARENKKGSNMRKNNKKPMILGDVLESFLSRSGLKRRIQEQKILDLWERVVGQTVAERTEPIRVQNRGLQVKVDSSVWMQQLQFLTG